VTQPKRIQSIPSPFVDCEEWYFAQCSPTAFLWFPCFPFWFGEEKWQAPEYTFVVVYEGFRGGQEMMEGSILRSTDDDSDDDDDNDDDDDDDDPPGQ